MRTKSRSILILASLAGLVALLSGCHCFGVSWGHCHGGGWGYHGHRFAYCGR